MFRYLIKIRPLGYMYGSSGNFLSPDHLIGRSGQKFPPDAAAMSGLLFNVNREKQFEEHNILSDKLYVAGPFWAEHNTPDNFYVPIPRHRVIAKKGHDEWYLDNHKWQRSEDETKRSLEPDYRWQSIRQWNSPTAAIASNKKAVAKEPWEYVSFLHPKIQLEERVVEDGELFLESAVQMDNNYCLVYLSTYQLPDGWYRFGGEGHMVEATSHEIPSRLNDIFNQPIQRHFALIMPGVWGSNNLSYRYPQHPDFPKCGIKMLTEKAIPYRFRIGASRQQASLNQSPTQPPGRLGRGRYAVPSGSVYVVKQALNKTWWEFPDAWFPQEGKKRGGIETKEEGLQLKHFGCGLCLPIHIEGVSQCTKEPMALSKP